ncbi:hypothetical protein [Micromonospora sp. DT233]|uniref:hypothetical protein n=1 Tax=Micromonospora sp. DT233 TaxID=3393432 RepID=UPI003CEBF7A5
MRVSTASDAGDPKSANEDWAMASESLIVVLDVLEQGGPTELISGVRAIEAADPSCMRWARNKRSDDATAVYAT